MKLRRLKKEQTCNSLTAKCIDSFLLLKGASNDLHWGFIELFVCVRHDIVIIVKYS